MSFGLRVTNYCTQKYNAAELYVMALPYGVGKSAQNLKAAIATIPAVLRAMAAAGSHQRTAARGVLQGVNIGLGVATGASGVVTAIPLACGSLIGFSIANTPTIARFTSLIAPIPAAVFGLGSVGITFYSHGTVSAIAAFIYFYIATISGPMRAAILGSNGEEVTVLALQMGAGVAAGASSTLIGFTPIPSVLIGSLAAEAGGWMSGRRMSRRLVLMHEPPVGLMHRPKVVATGLIAGAAITCFVVAGPLGAIGGGAAAGALLNTAAKIFRMPAQYLAPIIERFQHHHEAVNIARRQALLRQHLSRNLPVDVVNLAVFLSGQP